MPEVIPDSRELVRTLLSTLESFEIVDLSHALEEGMPAWPSHARFGQTLYESYELGDIACHYGLTMSEHTGTHMDAPLHFIPEGPAHYGIDEISLDRLVGRAATIDAAGLEPGGLLNADHIRSWERKYGPIKTRDKVLFRYSWDERWATGPEGRAFLEDWPGLGGHAAEYLVDKEISLVGCDTLAIDAAGSVENPAHYTLLGSEVYIIENLNNLDRLPSFCLFAAFPLKIRGGSGSPVRAVALVPR
jgi:kynurenine formamidase